MAKKKELTSLSNEELDKQLGELRMELIKANSQVASGGAPKNPGSIKPTRKRIARMLQLKHLRTKEAAPKDG